MREHEAQQNAIQTNPENLLYHYTDQDGLYGILTNSCIWATDYRFLNDTSERQHAIALFSEANSRRARNSPASGPGADIRKYISDKKQSNIEVVLRSIDAYYVSFTKEDLDPQLPLTSNSQFLGDRLSQWRGYAHNRQGFSLGFSSDRLFRSANHLREMTKSQVSIELLDCIYSDDHKSAIVSDITVNGPINIQALRTCMARFKHIAFEQEKESRLVILVPTNQTELDLVQFRNGPFGRTPFIKVPLGLTAQDSPLERIVVGPSQYMDQAVRILEAELIKMRIQNVKVVASKIPYRS